MKSEFQRLRKLCDSLHSVYVRARDNRRFGGICPICRMRPIECAFHFLGRAKMATRWHDDNVVGACCECNRLEFVSRGDSAKERWRLHHIALVGLERRAELEALAQATADFDVAQLKDLAAAIRVKIKNVWSEVIE